MMGHLCGFTGHNLRHTFATIVTEESGDAGGRHQLLSMMLDAVYVDMAKGLVLGLKPKPEFLPLFNLDEPVTTCDSELVTGGMEQSPSSP